MKAKIEKPKVSITIDMTEHELCQLLMAIGCTSERDRCNIGMTKEQSQLVGILYDVLRKEFEETM